MDVNRLFDAAFRNDAAAIAEEVQAGADPSIIHPRGGHTPLQVASQRGASNAVVALLRAGADPNLRFDWVSRVDGRSYIGRTALMYASSAEVVQLLIRAGADVNAVDSSGWSSLALALEKANAEVFKELLMAGGDTNLFPVVGGESLSLMGLLNSKRKHLLSIADSRANAVLAARLDSLESIEEVLHGRYPSDPARP